jgi:hypothetical protein
VETGADMCQIHVYNNAVPMVLARGGRTEESACLVPSADRYQSTGSFLGTRPKSLKALSTKSRGRETPKNMHTGKTRLPAVLGKL